MSFALSSELQLAVFQRLRGDGALAALVGDHIYDAVPTNQALPPLYVSLGPESVADASDMTGTGTRHDFTVSVVSAGASFLATKRAGEAISSALLSTHLALAAGRVVGLWFVRAKARKTGAGQTRRLDLIFRARICAG